MRRVCGIQARAEEVELLWGNGQDQQVFLAPRHCSALPKPHHFD